MDTSLSFFQNRVKILGLAVSLLFLNAYPNKAKDFIFKQNQDSLSYRIDKIMSAHSGNDRPGAVIGIIRNKELVFVKGYGMADLHLKKPNSPEVSYKIASVSKQFTAAIIVSLIRKNKLSLTDDIRKFLPQFPAYGKIIKVSDLLYHTSGIRDYMVLMWLTGKSFEDKFSNKDALEMIYRQKELNFVTGTRCVYSNSNYVLLAEIVKKVSGKALAIEANDELFKPLGMKKTSFNGLGKSETKALSYYKDDSGYHAFKNDNLVTGDGGVLTTLGDLVNWDRTFYEAGSLAENILIRGKLDNGNLLTYGMGIMTGTYKGKSIQTHPGAILGYRAELLRFPEQKTTIICLGNTEEINPEQITKTIADAYIFNEEIKPASPNSADYKTFPGKYEVAPNIFVDVRLENGVLSGAVTGQPRQMLIPQEDYKFSIGSSGDTAIFSGLSNGKSLQLKVVQKRGTTIAKRPEIISGKLMNNYTGSYYCAEQNTTYAFYIKDGNIYFKPGSGAAQQVDILKKYNRIYFGYRDLEQATIDFQSDEYGNISGFVLNSGRIANLQFVKK